MRLVSVTNDLFLSIFAIDDQFWRLRGSSASPMLADRLAIGHIEAMFQPAVEVENLVKHYPTAVAVDGICFTVRRGVTAALLGGNGAGKTTTLSILLGLLLPTAGSVRVLGEDMLRHRYRVLPRMNFSSPFVDLLHRLTARQNLSIYARLYGLPRHGERIASLADDLQIGEFLERPAGKLSAGQKTRVALVKALMNEPELLLLDEPTASLDPPTARAVEGLLDNWLAADPAGRALVWVSHDADQAHRMTGRRIYLRAGRLESEESD